MIRLLCSQRSERETTGFRRAAAAALFFLSVLAVSASAETIRVTAAQAQLFFQPSMSAKVFRVVPQGTELTVVESTDEWLRVKDPLTGYGAWVRRVDVAPAETPEKGTTEARPAPATLSGLRRRPEPVTEAAPRPVVSPRDIAPREHEQFRRHVSVACGGGGTSLQVGSYKPYYASYNEYRAAYSPTVKTLSGGLKTPLFGVDAGAEVILRWSPRSAIGFGAGYLRASSKSATTLQTNGETRREDDILTLSAVPVRIGFYYFMPLSGAFESYVDVSPVYFIANVKRSATGIYSSGYWEVGTWDFSGKKLGFELALGLRKSIGGRLALFAEARGRYAKVKPLKGEFGFRDRDSHASSYAGRTLFSFERNERLSSNWFREIAAFETSPATCDLSSFCRNVNAAHVDLTGIALKLGVEINFH